MSKIINVNRSAWAMYGAHLNGKEGFFVALSEFLSNAIDAVENSLEKRININMNSRNICIEDTGCGMTDTVLEAAMQYGSSTQKGPNNEFGTGIKTGFSVFDPVNGNFCIETTTPAGSYQISGPYSDQMEIQDIPVWKYGKISTRMSSPLTCKGSIPTDREIVEWLSLTTKAAAREGISIYFNGSLVLPVVPSMTMTEEVGSFLIGGRKKAIEVEQYVLDNTSVWTPSGSRQGVYLFINNRFVAYTGLDLVPNNRGGFTHRGIHNEYNSLVTFVYLKTPNTVVDNKSRLPINSCKTSVDWECSIGSQYREAIGRFIGAPYKTEANKYRLMAKAAKEERLKVLPAGAAFTKNCWLDKRRTIKVPAIIFKTASQQDAVLVSKLSKDENILDPELCNNGCVDTFVFFANSTKPVELKTVLDAIASIALFESQYGYKPVETFVYGDGVTDDAKALLNSIGKGLGVKAVEYPNS